MGIIAFVWICKLKGFCELKMAKKTIQEMQEEDVYDPQEAGEEDLPDPNLNEEDDESSSDKTDEEVVEIDLREELNYQILSSFLENEEGVNAVDALLQIRESIDAQTKMIKMFGKVMERSLKDLQETIATIAIKQ